MRRPLAYALMAIPGPLRVDPAQIEALLRVWMALAPVRAGLRRTAQQDRRLELGTRAACALHDLRHELTIAGLEIERVSAGHGPIPTSGLDPIRSALCRARALAEIDVESRATNPETLVLVAGVLREEATAALSVAGRDKAVRIELHVAEGLAFPTDRRMLSRIVRNLALNAVESSPDGERVSIEAEVGARGELVLRVTDRGRGMSHADREDLFRFGRSGRGGWGVGSSSIESCARRIGATCSIESRLGAGTAVELRVPAASRTAGD